MVNNVSLRVRRSISDVQADYDAGNTKELSDLMRAWKGIKELPATDPNSFFMLGGFHGEPFRGPGTYANAWWGGYCQHGTVLFPTWHRVYLFKLEKALQSIPGCENVTLPFWDECSLDARNNGIPRALTDEKFTLDDGVEIDNPLRSFVLPIAIIDRVSQDNNDPNSPSSAVGITAPSLADISSTRPYNVRSLLAGFRADSRDDIFNPRRGINFSLNDEFSSHSLGSDFTYQLITIDAAKFFPVVRNATLGIHGRAGISTGAIPTNKLFIFSDQDLRGYSDPFYGTDILLGQAELRVPLTQDRKFAVVGFVESGGTRIRGGKSVTTDVSGLTTTTFDLNRYTFHSDVGVGLRFDVPQLGLHTIRLDFAKGSQGTHTSFGIGQSF